MYLNIPDRILSKPIDEIIAPDIVRLAKTTSIDTVIERLRLTPHGVVFVEDDEGELRGAITPWEFLKFRTSQPEDAGTLATSQFVAIKRKAQFWQAFNMMKGDNSFGLKQSFLAVVDGGEKKKVVGIITWDSLQSGYERLCC